MLGKLAKYLRFMGYDTFYPPSSMSDEEIIRIGREEGRVIITRDRELAHRGNGVFVESDNYEEQLRFMIKKFNLSTENMLSRCSICNTPLVQVPKEKVRDKVPEYVYEHTNEFYLCPNCGKIYWYGTHTERIKEKIKRIEREAKEHED